MRPRRVAVVRDSSRQAQIALRVRHRCVGSGPHRRRLVGLAEHDYGQCRGRRQAPSARRPAYQSTIAQRLFDGKALSQFFHFRLLSQLLVELCRARDHVVPQRQAIDGEQLPRRPDLR